MVKFKQKCQESRPCLNIVWLYESKFSPSTCKKNHDFDQAITNSLFFAFPFSFFLGSKSLGADQYRYILLEINCGNFLIFFSFFIILNKKCLQQLSF